jgi:hypothetical protein
MRSDPISFVSKNTGQGSSQLGPDLFSSIRPNGNWKLELRKKRLQVIEGELGWGGGGLTG